MSTKIVISSLAVVLSASACQRGFNNDADVKHLGEIPVRKSGPWAIDYSTPLGMKLFQESLQWLDDQPEERAQPANCAYNVSAVYENSGFDGNVYKTYSDPLVRGMLNKAEQKGGKVVSLWRGNDHSKATVIDIINDELGGKIPVGAMIAGCQNKDCTGAAGSGHIAMLGDVYTADDERAATNSNDRNAIHNAIGYTKVYHNNWYRPENEGGSWKPFMISKKHHNEGCMRQWMPTPWIKFIRQGDKIIDIVTAFPTLHKIDDLDPLFRPNVQSYFGFIGISKEMWEEIQAGRITRGGNGGGVVAGKIECPQGYTLQEVGQGKMCGDGTNALGPFTESMRAKCLQWSPNDPVCASDRWGWDLAKNARGSGVCPIGAQLDAETTYCVEGNNAFGPFPAPLVAKCEAANGGSACKSARWSKTFLRSLMGN